MVIKVCVGSSCHLKGSYEVVEAFKSLVKKYNVQDRIELQASFCLGNCLQGVSAAVEDFGDAEVQESEQVKRTEAGLLLSHLKSDNTEKVFVDTILPLLK
jgi:NADH:ubiquinone oxidoreductase subunit E